MFESVDHRVINGTNKTVEGNFWFLGGVSMGLCYMYQINGAFM